jgi:hypothetical protein
VLHRCNHSVCHCVVPAKANEHLIEDDLVSDLDSVDCLELGSESSSVRTTLVHEISDSGASKLANGRPRSHATSPARGLENEVPR